MKAAFALLLLSTSALAQVQTQPGAPATVTLTQDQLQRLITGEQAKAAAAAVSQYVAQEKESTNKDIYDLVKSAFAPKPQPKETPNGH